MRKLKNQAVCNISKDLNTHLQATETAPHMTKGRHIPAPQQALPQAGLAAHGPGRPTATGNIS